MGAIQNSLFGKIKGERNSVKLAGVATKVM